MANITVKSTYQDASGTILVKNDTVESDEQISIFRRKIDVGVTDLHLYAEFAAARILAVAMAIVKSSQKASSTGTVALKIETNSGSVPDDTFDLTSDVGVVWSAGDTAANPFTADVTDLYVTNTGTVACDLTIKVALDLEPEFSSSSSSSSTSSINSSSSSSSLSSSSSSSVSASSLSSASSASSQSSSSGSASSASSNSSSSSSSSSKSLSSGSSASESSASGL